MSFSSSAFVVAVFCLNGAYGQEAKLSSDLASLSAPSSLEVIVQYKNAPRAADHRRMETRGARLLNEFEGSNAVLYQIPSGSLPSLETDGEVMYVSPNRPLRAMAPPAAIGYDYMPA